MNNYLQKTKLLDYDDPAIEGLVAERSWRYLPPDEKIGPIYDFVRNGVPFGYNRSDDLPASAILKDGYGQCNTKATLFMALLRSAGVPCRFHGFAIDKKLQKGAVDGIFYRLAPQELLHSWVEVQYDGRWVNLEGLIIDDPYLDGVKKREPACDGPFCGYCISTGDLRDPKVGWTGEDTYIQRDSITRDLGVFDSPDEFYRKYGTNMGGLKGLIYVYIVRRIMNQNIRRIRQSSARR